jgi:hypothetical protein
VFDLALTFGLEDDPRGALERVVGSSPGAHEQRPFQPH